MTGSRRLNKRRRTGRAVCCKKAETMHTAARYATIGENEKRRIIYANTCDGCGETYISAGDGRQPAEKAQLRYDAEGCGCAVSGVPTIWLTDELTGQCERIETNGLPLYIQTSQKVFFDEEMTIDYNEKAKTLVLKSPAEMLSPRMSIIVKQGETESESKAESH